MSFKKKQIMFTSLAYRGEDTLLDWTHHQKLTAKHT